MGLHNVELYNNLGLSCFYAQQYDMTLACMERALEMATDESLGNWPWCYDTNHIDTQYNKTQ